MTSICPECDAELPDSAPLGMCPGCLLRSARGHSFAGGHRTADENEPPPCEELAEIFAGKFEFEELIGRGGMGAVYRARQCRIDRPVAIKLLPFHNGDPEYLERFLREAKALGKLNHPNIVTLIDYGEVGRYFYLVMEFVNGGDLGQRLAAGNLAEAEVARIIGQVCDALDYAHARGVVHRDIKPGNILLGDDVVKLVDFGLAKGMESGDLDLSLTWANEMMGTPDYMAPEQRANPLDADRRSDIYSLGVITYEMLTGILPTGNFPLPSKVKKISRRWDNVVLKAMSSAPDQRYPGAAEMGQSTRDLASKNYRPIALWGVAVFLVLLAGLAATFFKAPVDSISVPATPEQPGGRVITFGPNLYGQVTKLGSLERDDIVAVAANDEFLPDHCFALALTARGEVVGIGDAPEPPSDLGKVSSIAVGLAHCLALSEDGKVVAWGYDQFPPPPDLPPIQQVAAAGQLSAALSIDGKVFVWGVTPLGNSIEFEPSVNRDFAEIAAAPGVIIARTSDGKVILRGDPEDPALIYREPDQAITAISAGQDFGMALLRNGRIWSWGWDEIGDVPADNGSRIDRIVSGPEPSAMVRGSGDWVAWGKIGTYFPAGAERALDVDFGHHVGLAVVPANQIKDFSPPPRPQPLKKIAVLGPHRGEVNSLAFAPGHSWLFAASDDAIHAYDVDEGNQLAGTYHAPPDQPVTALAWDSKSGHLVAGFGSGRVRVFSRMEFPATTKELETGSTAAVSALALNQGAIFAGDFEGFLNTWIGPGLNPGSRFHLHENAITAIAPVGGRIFTYGWDSLLKVTTLTGEEIGSAGTILKSPAFGHDLAVSSDGRCVLASDWRGTLYRVNLDTLSLARSWRGHLDHGVGTSSWLGCDANARVKIAWSPDGELFASVGSDRTLRVWDAQKDALVARKPGKLSGPSHVVTFLDSRRIVTAGEAGHALAIWQIPPTRAE